MTEEEEIRWQEITKFLKQFVGSDMVKYLAAENIIERQKIMASILLNEKNGGNFMEALLKGVQDEVVQDVQLWNNEGRLEFVIMPAEDFPYIEGYMTDTTSESEVVITDVG